jgi:hypothetical protein
MSGRLYIYPPEKYDQHKGYFLPVKGINEDCGVVCRLVDYAKLENKFDKSTKNEVVINQSS